MRHRIALVLAMAGLLVGCAAKVPLPVAFQIPTRHIDYLKKVKPLLDKRCVVCHSCYNSPCQLKLDSFEGADRGATKRAVYNATRLKSMDPTCAENQEELGGYLEKHPNRGMPFGFPPLKQEEFDLVAGWLVQGAKGPDAVQQEILTTPKASDARAIKQWESFLNRDDAKHAMTARYLYEHLFLAHLK